VSGSRSAQPRSEHRKRTAGGNLLARYTGDSNSRSFVPFNGAILAEYYCGGMIFDHPDEIGSLTTATDCAGNLVQERLFLPFGEFLTGTGSAGMHMEFAQLPDYDPETDQYNTANRHYSPSGRWLSPDPLYLELHRLSDPQQLNLYSYARNNPLALTDPSGRDIAVDCDVDKDCDTATDQVNDRKGGQFKVEIGDDDKWHPVGNVDVSKLSDAEKAFYNALNDTNTHATLTAVSGDGNVLFGLSTGKGTNTVDVADTAQLAGAGLSPGTAVAHEAMEAYATAGGASVVDAHNDNPFPGFTLISGSQITSDRGTMVRGQSYVLQLNGTNSRYQVTGTYATPIPSMSLSPFATADEREAARNIMNTEQITSVKALP